jgi:2-dehydro-3-deoxygalactonokinase
VSWSVREIEAERPSASLKHPNSKTGLMSKVDTRDETFEIFVDMGTTNSRVWLTRGSEILARVSRPIGVRDSAREGSTDFLQAALREMIESVRAQVSGNSATRSPTVVAAAGMIGSPLGLAEVPHVQGPAGLPEIANAARWFHFREFADLSFLIVPGVRFGSLTPSNAALVVSDVMRGEETLCLGLIELGLIEPPALVLNLGSHSKAIQLNESGQIAASITTISGELIHAARIHTILASSLPKQWPAKLDPQWIQAGILEHQRSGLTRSLFCVRLKELAKEGTPDDRFAFLIGAIIGSDLEALRAGGFLNHTRRVIVVGHKPMTDAWCNVLSGMSLSVRVLIDSETERAFLGGLGSILAAARPAPMNSSFS